VPPTFSGCLQPVVGSGELPTSGYSPWSNSCIPPSTILLTGGIVLSWRHFPFQGSVVAPFGGGPAVDLYLRLGHAVIMCFLVGV
jgi:hypothetical protein